MKYEQYLRLSFIERDQLAGFIDFQTEEIGTAPDKELKELRAKIETLFNEARYETLLFRFCENLLALIDYTISLNIVKSRKINKKRRKKHEPKK